MARLSSKQAKKESAVLLLARIPYSSESAMYKNMFKDLQKLRYDTLYILAVHLGAKITKGR